MLVGHYHNGKFNIQYFKKKTTSKDPKIELLLQKYMSEMK